VNTVKGISVYYQMASVLDMPTIPGVLCPTFERGFYSDPTDAEFKAPWGAVASSSAIRQSILGYEGSVIWRNQCAVQASRIPP
jgi:hypothetical protein